jgi:hypothetical protein
MATELAKVFNNHKVKVHCEGSASSLGTLYVDPSDPDYAPFRDVTESSNNRSP